MSKPICIYHGNCADGFTAAWAVWKRFGDEFDYFPGVYQQPPPDVTRRDVLLVDFSYKRDVLRGMAKSARSILVLDHHKSAAEDLHPTAQPADEPGPHVRRIPDNGGYDWEQHIQNTAIDEAQNVPYCEVYTYFDMERSGAGIAWDYFHPGVKRPALVDYVEDRDLWRFKIPGSRAINAFVFSYHYDFSAWDEMARFLDVATEEAERAGMAIERKHHKDVAELVATYRREMIIGGHWVPVANLPYTLTSDAGNLMCKPYASDNLQGEIVTPPFAACYWDTPNGRVFSLRSVGDFDVSVIAAMYGGGGHKNASGFTLPHGENP